jgi:hypothetical protein
MKTALKFKMRNLFESCYESSVYNVLIVFVLTSFGVNAQYVQNETFKEVGAGNFFLHLESESDLKRTIKEVLKENNFPKEELSFNKGKNLFFAAYLRNPKDEHYTYFIHAEKVREGYDLYLLYIENSYHHFFDYSEGPNRFRLIYDPEKDKNTILTSKNGEEIKD